jgi:hypothetical protein
MKQELVILYHLYIFSVSSTLDATSTSHTTFPIYPLSRGPIIDYNAMYGEE